MKHKNLKNFFQDLKMELKTPKQEFYSCEYLEKYNQTYYSKKQMTDCKSSIKPFWMEYIGIESQITFHDMQINVDKCLTDYP